MRRYPGPPWTRQQFLDAVLPNGLLFSPGDSWAYSNVGYMLVVDVLGRVTGRTFARVLAELVTEPLGLQQTSVLETVDDLGVCVPDSVRRSMKMEPLSTFAVAITQAGARLAWWRPRRRRRNTAE